MAIPAARSAQQRDARELATTRPADPYRGGLTDPFSNHAPLQEQVAEPDPAAQLDRLSPFGDGTSAPGQATLAGIIGIVLGITLGLFGMVLVTILNLQNEYGAPDRSFYRGTDSGYLVLALADFGLAGCSAIGAILMLNGRVSGRIALTVTGWSVLLLAAFWLLRGQLNPGVPLVVGLAAALMLVLSYQQSVTRWLGVLAPPQPE